MQTLRFDAAVDNILLRDKRFEAGAYFLLKEALDFTLKRTREECGQERHVSGQELLFGYRDYALQEFGPMACTLLREWGVRTCADVGDQVFLLIEEGMFGKQDSDTREDFCDHFDFEEAFLKPFQPECLPADESRTETSGGAISDDSSQERPFRAAPQDAS